MLNEIHILREELHMELNFEELAQKEVTRIVGEKINKKLHLQIQKELKSHEYTNIVRQHTINEVGKFLKTVDLSDYIDKERIHADVVQIIANELLGRLTGSDQYEDYDHY